MSKKLKGYLDTIKQMTCVNYSRNELFVICMSLMGTRIGSMVLYLTYFKIADDKYLWVIEFVLSIINGFMGRIKTLWEVSHAIPVI